jgi:hypothetical protein
VTGVIGPIIAGERRIPSEEELLMGVVYGRVRFRHRDEEIIAELTAEGWNGRNAAGADVSAILDTLADPSLFSAADGDPMRQAVIKLATLFGGTYEVLPVESPPPGTV